METCCKTSCEDHSLKSLEISVSNPFFELLIPWKLKLEISF
jgi:hypothetical protein